MGVKKKWTRVFWDGIGMAFSGILGLLFAFAVENANTNRRAGAGVGQSSAREM